MVCTDKDCFVHLSRSNSFKWNGAYWQEKEQTKMTREEAEKVVTINAYDVNTDKLFTGRHMAPEKQLVRTLEALGLLKFDEPKEIVNIFKINNDGSSSCIWGDDNRYGKQIGAQYGTVKLEVWPEGLVLWVGGEIKWRSWH